MTTPAGFILVFNGDSGLPAMLVDVVRKAMGQEDCALCEIVYSPLGKRRAWKACTARLAVPVQELHRDQVPSAWGITLDALPCILAQSGTGETPTLLFTRDEIARCGGSVEKLERMLHNALSGPGANPGLKPTV